MTATRHHYYYSAKQKDERQHDDASDGVGMRRCIISQQSLHQKQMIRLVKSPDNYIVPDMNHKLPGRGIWLYPSSDNLALAEKILVKKAQKIWLVKIFLPEMGLAQLIEQQLMQQMTQTISLMRRAGQAIQGTHKINLQLQQKNQHHLILLIMKETSALQAHQKIITLAEQQKAIIIANLPAAIACDSFKREHAPLLLLTKGGLAKKMLSLTKQWLILNGHEDASDVGMQAKEDNHET